jgi:hypothetical protein
MQREDGGSWNRAPEARKLCTDGEKAAFFLNVLKTRHGRLLLGSRIGIHSLFAENLSRIGAFQL